MELNPGFDGKITRFIGGTDSPKIENGEVTECGIAADNLTDISPLRALAGLRVLDCAGSDNRSGKVSDLSPLQGMKLTGLHFWARRCPTCHRWKGCH